MALGAVPLANAFTPAGGPARDEAQHPLSLEHCGGCGLVQLGEAPPDEVLARSFLAVRPDPPPGAAAALAPRLAALGKNAPGTRVVDVAHAHGTLEAGLAALGLAALGVDPHGAPAGDVVTPARFDAAVAQDLARARGRFDVVLLRSVLGHVAAPRAWLGGARALLEAGGRIVACMPGAHALAAGVAFDLVFHEHLAYFDAESLDRLARAEDLALVDVEHTPDGTMWAVLAHGDATPGPSVARAREEARRLPWGELGARIGALAERQHDLVEALGRSGERVAGYAAAARAMALSLRAGLDALLFAWGDANPRKQGTRVPGGRCAVLSPGALLAERPDVLVLGVSSARDALCAQLRAQGFQGRFVVPFPEPAVWP